MARALLAEPAVLEHLRGNLLGGQDVDISEAGFGGVDVRGECCCIAAKANVALVRSAL